MNRLDLQVCLSCNIEGGPAEPFIDIWVAGAIDGRWLVDDCFLCVVSLWTLAKALEEEGRGYPFVCTCGDAGCAGFFRPDTFRHDGNHIDWELDDGAAPLDRERRTVLVFAEEQFREAVLDAVADVRACLAEAGRQPELLNLEPSYRADLIWELAVIDGTEDWHLQPLDP